MNTSYVLFLTIILLLVLCSKSDELVYFSNTLEGKIIILLLIILVTYSHGLCYGAVLTVMFILSMEFSSTREYLQNIEDTLMFKNVKCSKAAFDDDISNVKYKLLDDSCKCKNNFETVDENERIQVEKNLRPKPSVQL